MTNVTIDAARLSRRRRPPVLTISASAWIVVVILGAVFAGILAPQGSNAQNVAEALQGPSAAHILGTDSLGRDLLVRMLYGARPTLIATFIVVVITVVIGGAAGLAGGYIGGRLDRLLSVIADIAQSIPGLLISLVIFSIIPNGLYPVMAVTALFMCAGMYRVVRGATLTVRNELYIAAARAAGLSHRAIIWRHLLPRLSKVIRVQASMMAALAIVIEISLGFLGLDVAPPAPSWGNVLQEASQYLTVDFWMLVPPMVIIALTIVAFGVLGDAVQVPRQKRSRAKARNDKRIARRASGSGADVTPTSNRAADGDPELVATPQDADVLLRVRNLSVRTTDQNNRALVDGVSFDVLRGEVLGFVGETGAGKSVIARSLFQASSKTVATGEIIYGGVDLTRVGEDVLRTVRGRRIAYVGQDPMAALDPLFRVGHQLVEAIQNHRRTDRAAAKQEALRLLKAVKLASPDVIARKYPFELSGGQAQRVAIALALAGDPELLVADEPTTALDVTVQMEVLGLLKELQRSRGLTMILVTHDWGVVADMCDRVLTLYAGEVVEVGPVREVFADPCHPYTAALRRADPHLQNEGEKLHFLPGRVPPPGSRPTGCRFADRCALVIDACRETHPALVSPEPDVSDRASRCIRIDELRKEMTDA